MDLNSNHCEENFSSRNLNFEKKFWHDPNIPMTPLGCLACPDYKLCGGLRTRLPLFDCNQLCCEEPKHCDKVCRRNAKDFAYRIREVNTLSLETIKKSNRLSNPILPTLVPMQFHKAKLGMDFGSKCVCFPLYSMFDRRTARLRHSDKTTLLREMGISGNPQIILSGVNHDAPLERWWSYGAEKRIELAKGLKRMGVEMVTTPNYSLFIDRPRWDDLHSIKRIATTFEEFQEAQLPAALHVNGRTERDFERWGDFIKKHDEVAWISYEFGTGTGWAGRLDLHVSWLSALADSVGRPLSIVLRGGLSRLSELRNHYQAVTYLDTNVFMKTVKRQQARIEDGKLVWRHSSTPNGEALSRLARSNFEVVEGLFQP